ncbi:hypothetical protein O6H91_06G139900 [Diphasiastrum complanatum]|uniref:Uncharacterized protein n=1 Tax=Diphasiastrum complanatum TaxID=34168 RepID=A0ACC2DJE8_DIPCM|nr:hypothetical protein O6H91_06G139900 [Diphasiastrum complanatum]
MTSVSTCSDSLLLASVLLSNSWSFATLLSLHSCQLFTLWLGANLPPAAYGKAEFSKDHTSEGHDDEVDEETPESPDFFSASKSTTGDKPWEEHVSDEEIESEVELDNEGVVPPDNEPPQKMGDPSIEVTEEMRDNAQVEKFKAMDAAEAGDLEAAVGFLTEAIISNPTSAILYASRAGIYVKMSKPNAAIRDAEAALTINPDSAKGYKWRGEAKALLGQWEEAVKDLRLASRLDYDDEIAAVLKKVEPNARRLEEHRRKYERLRKERQERKAERERQRRRAKAQASYEKAKRAERESSSPRTGGATGNFAGGGPGSFPGGSAGNSAGGWPGSFPGSSPGGVDMSQLLNDPELLAAFQDPEVMAALQDVMKNPANLANHQDNPKVAPLLNKMMSNFGGAAV